MLKRLIWVIFGLLFLAACQNEEPTLPTFTPNATLVVSSPTPRPTATRIATLPPVSDLPAAANLNPNEPALVRVVQANPELEAVDIYLNTSAVAPRFRPGSYSNAPVEVPSGSILLRIMPAGSPPSSQAALFEGQLELQPAQNLVIYFYGTADSIQLATYDIDTSPLEDGQTRLYFIHAVATGAGVNVLADGDTIAEDLVYGQQTDPVEIDAGQYALEFKSGNTTLASLEQEFEEKQVYTVLITQDTSPIVFSEPATPETELRLVHAAFDAPPVRILLDDEVLVEDFDYQSFTPDFFALESGRYQVRVEAMDAAETDPPLLDTPITFNPNEQIYLLLHDNLKLEQFKINTDPTAPSEARLTVINAAAALPHVTAHIPTATGTTKNFPVAFGKATLPQAILPGAQSYEFVVDDVILWRTEELLIEAGASYTLILMGEAGGEKLLLAVPVGEAEEAPVIAQNRASIRFVNASSQPLTFLVNDEVLAEDVARGELSPPNRVPQGDLTLEIQDGSGTTRHTLNLVDEQVVSVFVSGSPDSLQIFTFDDPAEIFFAGRTRVRVVNMMAEAVFPSLAPADEGTAALMGIPFESGELLTIGDNPIEFGQIAMVDVPEGDYRMLIYNLEGTVLHEEPFEPVVNLFYELVFLETDSGIEILKIPREPN